VAHVAGAGVDTEGFWPNPRAGHPRAVVIVCRSHAAGLAAAKRRLAQFAAHGPAAELTLLGLLVVADAPGRLPRELRRQLRVISAITPKIWELPWVEAWRFGEREIPKPVAATLAEIVNAARATVPAAVQQLGATGPPAISPGRPPGPPPGPQPGMPPAGMSPTGMPPTP
jgi:hypothetical protein